MERLLNRIKLTEAEAEAVLAFIKNLQISSLPDVETVCALKKIHDRLEALLAEDV